MQQHAIVYFPHVNLDIINSFREKYDPDRKIIKPHITLVQPLSGISEKLLITHLETITQEIKSFQITISGITKSFDNYVFLLIKEGAENIVRMHKKLYSDILDSYLQTDVLFIPHMTIGYFGEGNNDPNNELFQKAYGEAKSLNINLTCNFDEIALIKGDGLKPAKIIRNCKLAL